jgi:hypothetical protein
MKPKTTLAVLSAAALVAFPAGAMAKGGHGGPDKADDAKTAQPAEGKKPKKPKKPKVHTYEFKGLVTAVGDGTISVEVKAGNSRAKKLKGQTLTFDVTKAKLKVADVNQDGKRDLADVAVGDRVNVQAKLPRSGVDASQALPARHVVDKGPAPAPKPEEEPKPEEAPAPPA